MQLADGAQAKLQFIVNILGYQSHFFDDFLFVIEFLKRGLQFAVTFFEADLQLAMFCLGGAVSALGVGLIDRQIE